MLLAGDKIRKFKIKGMPSDKEFAGMPFGRQIEHWRTIAAFKETAKSVHLSQKHRSWKTVLAEAKKLYEVDQFFCEFFASEFYFDDSFEFFYTTK